jgi:hypothetical protein
MWVFTFQKRKYDLPCLQFKDFGAHIGARALHVLILIGFGCIARLSQRGEEV